jgi:hypothetical protein
LSDHRFRPPEAGKDPIKVSVSGNDPVVEKAYLSVNPEPEPGFLTEVPLDRLLHASKPAGGISL